MELDEQPQQPLRQIGVDIAGRFVRQQKLGLRNDSACDRSALLFPAGEHGRQCPKAIAEAHPLEKLHHLLAVALLALPNNPQRQRDVLKRRHVIEQPKILKHDADATPQRRERVFAQRGDLMTKYGDEATGRPQREEEKPQQRGLACPRRAGKELKGAWIDAKGKIAQDLGTEAVAQTYMLKSHHVSVPTGSLLFSRGNWPVPQLPLIAARRAD